MPITDRHADYDAFAPQWSRVRDAVAGGDAIKAAGTKYLPKPGAMNQTEYKSYKTRAEWYDVTERTKRGLVGIMLRKEPKLVLPEALERGLDTLPVKVKSFAVFVRQLAGEIVSVGRHGILVDMPGERPIGTLPVWAGYNAESIRMWGQFRLDGRFTLLRVVLSEPDETESDASKQFRELVLVEGLYEVRIWRKTEAKGEFEIVDSKTPTRSGKRLDFIPFVFVGVDDLDPDVEKPPLLGLTDANIAHYQITADYRWSLFLTGQPTTFVAGFQEDEIPKSIGGAAIWAASDANAKAEIIEVKGPGLDASRVALQDKQEQMVLLGARFLEKNKAGVEAAETMRLRLGADNATLTTIAQTAGSGLQQALKWTAEWAGLTGDISVEMNTEFLTEAMGADDILALIQAWQTGAIAREDMLRKFKTGGVVSEDRTAEQIQSETETQPVTIPFAE